MGRRIEVDSTVVAFVQDRTFSFVTSAGPFPFRGSFTTTPTAAGTRLTSEFVAEPTGVLRFADGLFGSLIRRKFEGDLANLKRLMEATSSNGVPRSARHREDPVRAQQERRQVGRDVRERQDVRVQLDPERLAHEPPTRLDPLPGGREAAGERRAQRLVGEGEPVLDVAS